MKRLLVLLVLITLISAVGVFAECTETDDGKDFAVKGTTTYSKGNNVIAENVDLCINSGTLTEYFCDQDGKTTYENYACNCVDGACTDVTETEEPAEVPPVETPEEPKTKPAGTELPKGLSVALTKVKNENAKQMIQQNLERFQENYQQRLQKMEGVEVEEVDEETGEVKVKAKEPVKYFGLINGKATKRFSINVEGKIEEKAPWYKFLYRETTG